MKREETLFEPSYEFMRERGYKITKNSKFNEFKSNILIFRAYSHETEIEYLMNEECSFDPFLFTISDVIEYEEIEKKEIKETIQEFENMSKEELEEYDKETVKRILSFKKYL